MSIQREWQKFVRPPRYNYSYFDLGPEYIQLHQGYLRKHERIIINRQNSKLEMSYFELNPKTPNCIVYCHGYNGCRIEGIKYASIVAQFGFNFCTFDFQACGHSEGDFITFGHLEKDDITSILEELEIQFQQKQFILWGRSLGATTIQLKEQPNVKGLVLDSCFTNFNKLAISIIQKQTRLPKFIIKAIIFLTKGTIEEEAGFQLNDIQVQCNSNMPTLYICSDKDSLIKAKNSLKLYKQHKGIKKLIKVDGEHNDSRSLEIIQQICQWCKERVQQQQIQQTNYIQYNSVPQVARLPLELIYDSNIQSGMQSSYNRFPKNPAIKLKNQISIQLRTSCRNLHTAIQY
ncbi:unnamed protein product [Paramecium sonneborni]|uniref:Serine aminopeptidase S33 domain-containing protein n=1 Tax=Paramecium sonneborni TaxID=65129 RepID=A0A8S1PKS2_9CILI|nr:unnamed protein product [Paramecium sonneborni]